MRFTKKLPLLLVIVVVVELTGTAATPSTMLVKPGCPHSCGHLTIPYPFGTHKGCYLNESFLITCKDSQPFLGGSEDSPVLNISLDGGLRVSTSSVVYVGYNQSGSLDGQYGRWMLTGFTISNTKNKIMVVGCDTYAYAQDSGGYLFEDFQGFTYVAGCVSLCNNITNVVNGSCSGIGCCHASFPKGVTNFDLRVGSFRNHAAVWEFNPYGVAFLVEEGRYIFSLYDLWSIKTRIIEWTWPVVFDWAVGAETCEEVRKNVSSYACGKNSICYDFTDGPGYRCNCSQGYKGNPYLPNGCQDIDECVNDKLHNCTNKCKNTPGSFKCSCPKGFHGDGVRGSLGCTPMPLIILGFGITVALLAGCFFSYWRIKRRKLIQLREKLFQQNGGLILQQQLSKLDSSVETAKIFTIEEVKKATNNFNESGIVGRGGFGTVYKGILPQKKIIAIKKSSKVNQSQVDQFVNEVIVLSQINHRSVVKLLGCCLETEVPLLVYEFITNGTLYHHLHDVGHVSSIPWKIRLRIANETAEALAYLHSAASIPIIHRDMKSTNILLDDNFTAKVSDFGASRLVPLDKTQLTTMVQGTLGYLDPEYFHTSHLSEKSDAYSFGVVLVELLTGRKALSFDKPEKERNLATYFLSSMKENRLSLILDDRIVNEGNANEIHEVANIAQRCLRSKGDKRPTMKEVAMKLEGLTRVEKHIWTSIQLNPDDSLKDQDIMPLEVDDGRVVSCPNLSKTMIGVSIQSTEHPSQVYQGTSNALKWDTI